MDSAQRESYTEGPGKPGAQLKVGGDPSLRQKPTHQGVV
ncbi:MAG: hypothetical protein ACI9DC_005131 [Gammaproteobacteria bacterium]|jgi:hypothetical protein